MKTFLSLFFVLVLTSVGFADTYRRNVPMNKTTEVGLQAVVNRDTCDGGPAPQMKVRRAPKNGTVSFKKIKFNLSERSGPCAGRLVGGTLVVYKPRRGFRGTDVFSVQYTMDAYTSGSAKIHNYNDKYIVEVK